MTPVPPPADERTVSATLLHGHALDVLRTLPDGIARCCVTSPPYFGLRDYGVAGQIGLEPTPDAYVAALVEVFREVRRVLTDDGTLWLNLGDSYAAAPVGSFNGGGFKDASAKNGGRDLSGVAQSGRVDKVKASGAKPKDLLGIPWRVAFALQADGWYLRSDIIWAKPNPMPESVTDRPTKAHEYVFLLSKRARYYYDAAAIAEETDDLDTKPRSFRNGDSKSTLRNDEGRIYQPRGTRNARTVWPIATQPYAGAHFATFPEELARRCILAGSASGDTVLDPFGGSGTVAQVATGNGRSAIHIDLNPQYIELARQRIGPMLCTEVA